ncbi:MAG: outer membrane lipoprotein-sorting protein [Candidatus Cloacimonadota bacterium]|nr:outer membrane lipoprotein-sorting protein [Candidatus Cloacimonadota bacterium]
MLLKKTIKVIILLFLTAVLGWSQSKELTGRDIAIMLHNRPDGNDRKSVMQMTLINKRGKTRERTLLSISKDYGKESKSIIFFQSPADVKGTGFLQYEYEDTLKEDDRWLYLPALKKVRRISGSSKNDYFMGTDFTYDDMGDRSVDEDNHKLLCEEKIDSIKCWVLESIPKDKDYMYSKKIAWIRQDALIPVKVEFYDRQTNLLKVLKITDIRKQNGFWTAFKMEMNNIQEKHKTILEIKEMHYDIGLKDNLFRVSSLERGRIKK